MGSRLKRELPWSGAMLAGRPLGAAPLALLHDANAGALPMRRLQVEELSLLKLLQEQQQMIAKLSDSTLGEDAL